MAAGHLAGVISSSSVVHVWLQILWTFKVDQPNLIPLTCSAVLLSGQEVICYHHFLSSIVIVLIVILFDCLFGHYKLHAGSSSKSSCHKRLNSVVLCSNHSACVFFSLLSVLPSDRRLQRSS